MKKILHISIANIDLLITLEPPKKSLATCFDIKNLIFCFQILLITIHKIPYAVNVNVQYLY